MPSGRVHDIITLSSAIPLYGITTYLSNVYISSILIISYVFAGLVFNGDLDLKSAPYKRWFIFRWVWKPYQMVFRHRSMLTHGIIIGTSIRLLYLGVLFLPLMIYYSNDLIYFLETYKDELTIILIGLECGAISHTLTDYIG